MPTTDQARAALIEELALHIRGPLGFGAKDSINAKIAKLIQVVREEAQGGGLHRPSYEAGMKAQRRITRRLLGLEEVVE